MFGFVVKHRGGWPVSWMCDALGVSRSGFHARLTRPRSNRSICDEELSAAIRASFLRSDRTYGTRRVWHDLLEEGYFCGLHCAERLMRQAAFRARPKRRQPPKDEGTRSIIAANVLEREFDADGPNQKWVADFNQCREHRQNPLPIQSLPCPQQIVNMAQDLLVIKFGRHARVLRNPLCNRVERAAGKVRRAIQANDISLTICRNLGQKIFGQP